MVFYWKMQEEHGQFSWSSQLDQVELRLQMCDAGEKEVERLGD